MIISAFAFQSASQLQLMEFVMTHHQVIITHQIADEARSVTLRKHPTRFRSIDRFLSDQRLTYVKSETATPASSVSIRDATDQGILDEALSSEVEIIVSGDKDFLAVEIKHPRMMSPREFIDEFMQGTT